MPPASNRKARVVIYGLILAISGTISATAITTAMRADNGRTHRTAPAITAHNHRPSSGVRNRPPATGAGTRVLLIATALRIPALSAELRDMSQATPPAPQPRAQRHRRSEQPHGVKNGSHKHKQ